MPLLFDLRASLDEAMEDLKELPASSDADIHAARSAVMPCIVPLRKDFIHQYGDESDILTDAHVTKEQPLGFKPTQVLAATSDDPRTKIL